MTNYSKGEKYEFKVKLSVLCVNHKKSLNTINCLFNSASLKRNNRNALHNFSTFHDYKKK